MRFLASFLINLLSLSLKISVSDTSGKMSSVFGLASDIFEMISCPVGLVSVRGKLDWDMMNVVHPWFLTSYNFGEKEKRTAGT